MSRTLCRLGMALAPSLLLLQMAVASDVPRYSFSELTDNSEIVVSGTVTRTWADWDPDHKYIWTHFELAVLATHKGVAGRTVDIAEPGGELDGMAMSISGATGYRVGENVLVFLSRMPNGYLRTAGFGQGKYTVDSGGRLHGEAVALTDQSLEGMTVSQVSRLVAARASSKGGAK